MFRCMLSAVACLLALEACRGETLVQIQTKKEGPAKAQSIVQSIEFGSQVTSYGLTYDISMPEGTPPGKCTSKQWIFRIGYIPLGMTSSGGPNWYTQGFLAVRLDGMSLHDIPGTWRIVRGGGPDALAEARFDTPKGPVFLRLAMRSGDDKLLLQLALAPETKAERVEMSLIAYPQGFEKPWDRRITTATRDATPSAVRLDLAREPWALFFDPGMKPPRRRVGPCGLVLVPDELASASIGTGYSVGTTLKARPGGRTLTVGLWDFTAIGEADQVAGHLRRDGSVIAADLQAVAQADWNGAALPAARLSGDYAKLLAGIAAARGRTTPYDEMTGQVVTPHRAWAKPLAGGPVRVLVVAPRWHQRDTVELAQRLDMVYDTVSFETPQSITTSELYLYGSYELYGYPRKTAVGVLDALRRQLEGRHDCIVLSGFQASLLPEHLRQLLIERVRAGSGLILAGDARRLLSGIERELHREQWKPDAVPAEHLPVLEKMTAQKKPLWLAYTLGRGRVLVLNYYPARNVLTPWPTVDDPNILGYHDYYQSLAAAAVLWTSRREMPVRIRFGEKEGDVTLDSDREVPDAAVEVLVDQPDREHASSDSSRRRIAKGVNRLSVPADGLAARPRFQSVIVRERGSVLGWATRYLPATAGRPQIATIELARPTVAPGGRLSGTVRLSQAIPTATVRVSVADALGRTLRRQSFRPAGVEVPFEFTLGQPVTPLHTVRAMLLSAGAVCDGCSVPFTVADRTLDDFHFLVWAGGSNNAVSHNILQVLADHGADWIDNTGLGGGSTEQVAAQVLNASRHGLASIPYITRISSEQISGRVRQPCLTDPKFLEPWTAGLRERALGAARFSPPGYTLGDENYLVSRAPLDVCTSPTCLAAFRTELKASYGSIGALNSAWQTTYRDWDEVEPATLEEVKRTPAHWPRWADHRLFMDRVFTRAHRLGREAIRSVDPGARVGFDGLFDLDSQHGYDFYQLCRACDMVQIYALHFMQVEYLRSFHQPGSIVGSWYNELGNRSETWAKRLGWHLLFHGFNSSWYWMAYETGPALLFPDLRPTPQLLWMEQSIREIQSGVGKLLLAARREHDGIAVHYSQASVHAGTLSGRPLTQAQTGVCRLLEDIGLQYEMLSYEQIERGDLKNYRVLVLPSSIALSAAEVRAIRQFSARGGILLADTMPGTHDAHCRPLERPSLADLFAARPGPRAILLGDDVRQYDGQRKSGQGGPLRDQLRKSLDVVGVRPAIELTADGRPVEGCEVIRFTDKAVQYVAVTLDEEFGGQKPEQVTIRLPGPAQVYDVRAHGDLGHRREFSARLVPGVPKVYALLPYAVKAVTVAPPGKAVPAGSVATFRLGLDLGSTAPAARHCVRLELAGPDGVVRRHYSRNVLLDTLEGKASLDLALNDPPGVWQVCVADVVSGRSAKCQFRLEAKDNAD